MNLTKRIQKFCNKCRMVLTYDAYNETIEQQTKKEDLQRIRKEMLKE